MTFYLYAYLLVILCVNMGVVLNTLIIEDTILVLFVWFMLLVLSMFMLIFFSICKTNVVTQLNKANRSVVSDQNVFKT